MVSAVQTEHAIGKGKLDCIRAILAAGLEPYWVFVGASMRDRDLTNFFSTEEFTMHTDEVWVMPFLVDTVDDFARQHVRYWARSGP